MKKILIVEDDASLNRALGIRLRSSGYEVVSAFDAVQATAAAVRHQPDLMVLDVSIPGGDGFALADRLQMLPETAHVPVVFVTASSRVEFEDDALRRSAAGFFRKPYAAADLIATLDQVLA